MPRPRELGQPSWPAILTAYVERGARHINKAEPARVLAYDSEAQTVDVQPTVQVEMSPGEYETPAPMKGVRVVWPGGAAGFLHVPLAAGDNVLIIHCDEDMSRWLNTGSVSAPAVQDRHGLHPVAIPGLNPKTTSFDATSGHVTLAATAELRLGADSATSAVSLDPLVQAQFTALKAAISAAPVVAGDGGAAFKAALVSALSSWPATTAATKVKAI